MLRPGDVVGDSWRIVARLGEGGMGTVWRAEDVRTGALVALKTISAGTSWDPELVGRFEREAVLAAKVDAAGGVARVHALRRLEQGVVMVQELVEGQDLGRLLRERGVDRARLVRLVAGVARTLARIHAAGVVHRDVKPSNIVVRASDDAPVLVDFGLAWSAEVSRLTASGVVLGTLSYMAPEQANSASTAHAPSVDVHALGAVLYHALTGRPPRVGAGLGALAELASGVPPPPPRSLDPTIDPALEALVLQALAFDPARRPTAAALAAALEAALAGGSPAGASASRPRGRPPVLVAVLVAVIAGLAMLAGVVAHDARRTARARRVLEEHARWEDTAVVDPLLPPEDVDARLAALEQALVALEGHDRARAREHVRRATAMRDRRARILAGRLERERRARGGSRALLAWAAELDADDPRRADAAADVAAAWRDVLRAGLLRGGDALTFLRDLAPAVDARTHSEALDATSDVWGARLAAAFEQGTEGEQISELARLLRVVDGATIGPALTRVVEEQSRSTVRQLRDDAAWAIGTGRGSAAFGLRLAGCVEAMRALPGGSPSADLVKALTDYVEASPSVDATHAEVLITAVRVGAVRASDSDAYFLRKRTSRGPAIVSALEARARAGDGAAAFLRATVLLPEAGGVPADPSELTRWLEQALTRPADLSPRHGAEARLLLALAQAQRVHLAGGNPAEVEEVKRSLAAARDEVAPWVAVRQLAVVSLDEVLARWGPEEERLPAWRDQLARLRRAAPDEPVDLATGHALAATVLLHARAGQTAEAERLQGEVEAHPSAHVRCGFIYGLLHREPSRGLPRALAVVDAAAPDAWATEQFLRLAAQLATHLEADGARRWLERARDAPGPPLLTEQRALALQTLAAAARR